MVLGPITYWQQGCWKEKKIVKIIDDKTKETRKPSLTGTLATGAAQILLHVKWPVVLETQLVLENLKAHPDLCAHSNAG